jgi:hypothetical protein
MAKTIMKFQVYKKMNKYCRFQYNLTFEFKVVKFDLMRDKKLSKTTFFMEKDYLNTPIHHRKTPSSFHHEHPSLLKRGIFFAPIKSRPPYSKGDFFYVKFSQIQN